MTTLYFGPAGFTVMRGSLGLPVPGTAGTLIVRHGGPDAKAPAIFGVLTTGEKISALEVYAAWPGLVDVAWKSIPGIGPRVREWGAALGELRVSLVVPDLPSQADIDSALQKVAMTLRDALTTARDALTDWYDVEAGGNRYAAFIRLDGSWWVADALPVEDGRSVSVVRHFARDASPAAARASLQAWAEQRGTPVAIQQR